MPGMGFGFGFGFHRRASGSSTPAQQLLTLASDDGWLAVLNASDPDTRTVRESGGNEFLSDLADGLDNIGSYAQATAADQFQLVSITNGGETFDVARGDGANTHMLGGSELNKTLPITLCAVLTWAGTAAFQDAWSCRSSSAYAGWWLGRTNADEVNLAFGSGSGTSAASRIGIVTDAALPAGLTVVSGIIRASDDMSVRFNGADQAGTFSGDYTGTPGYTNSNIALGALTNNANNLEGDVGFASFYDGDALADGVLTAMEDKLMSVYGIS